MQQGYDSKGHLGHQISINNCCALPLREFCKALVHHVRFDCCHQVRQPFSFSSLQSIFDAARPHIKTNTLASMVSCCMCKQPAIATSNVHKHIIRIDSSKVCDRAKQVGFCSNYWADCLWMRWKMPDPASHIFHPEKLKRERGSGWGERTQGSAQRALERRGASWRSFGPPR